MLVHDPHWRSTLGKYHHLIQSNAQHMQAPPSAGLYFSPPNEPWTPTEAATALRYLDRDTVSSSPSHIHFDESAASPLDLNLTARRKMDVE